MKPRIIFKAWPFVTVKYDDDSGRHRQRDFMFSPLQDSTKAMRHILLHLPAIQTGMNPPVMEMIA